MENNSDQNTFLSVLRALLGALYREWNLNSSSIIVILYILYIYFMWLGTERTVPVQNRTFETLVEKIWLAIKQITSSVMEKI